MSQFKFWHVSNDELFSYSDVIGARTAAEAAELYWAKRKEVQLADLNDGYRDKLDLPTLVYVVPMWDPEGYHDEEIPEDQKYIAVAFDSLWNKNILFMIPMDAEGKAQVST